jgi:hypothetical protein
MGRRGPSPGSKYGQTVRHVGWHRSNRGAEWRRVVEAPNWHDCWLQLVHATKGDKDGDRLILAAGQSPEQVPGCEVQGERLDTT